MTQNINSTRYYSRRQEDSVAELIDGYVVPNSGAGHFQKGDVINKDISLLCECKTCVKEKNSFSIKKEWIVKNRNESFATRFSNQAIAFNFGPDQENYFVINERLMRYLVEKLNEENS